MNKKWFPLLILFLLMAIQAISGEVYCDICKKRVTPLPNHHCPHCSYCLPSTSRGSNEGACGPEPMSLGMASTLQADILLPVCQVNSDALLAAQMAIVTSFNTGSASSVLQQIPMRLTSHFAELESTANQQIRNSNTRVKRIINTYYSSDGTNDSLDSSVYAGGYIQVSFDEATFYEAHPEHLITYLISQFTVSDPDEVLLIFFSPPPISSLIFLSLIFQGEQSILVTLFTQNETVSLQLVSNEDSILDLLSFTFSISQSTEIYAYYRSDTP